MPDANQMYTSDATKTVRTAAATDLAAISALHARAFGPGRFTRTAYRVREGATLISPFCHVCFVDEELVAAVRMTEVEIGGKRGALLLGPLAVDPHHLKAGYGRELVNTACDAARVAGHRLVILVGDETYYQRFGFHTAPHGQITFPGPVEPRRILVRELKPNSLCDYSGVVSARS